MKNCLVWFFIILVLVICSCAIGYLYIYYHYPAESWDARFGKEINPVREQIGIPSIPNTWNAPNIRQYESIWRSPDCKIEEDVTQRKLSDQFEPCYRQKWVKYWPENHPDSEQIPDIIEEADTYFGPSYVDIFGELIRESVNIVCQYNPNNPTWKRCEARALVVDKFRYAGGGEEVDVSTAIQVLEEWGISYP
ncbi:hypothetical protein DRJ25_06055 [Candidatus Woesearchaeota archaeon]|nr:MAG: hypothetical protein DRJ25_06055 [Candidatus Woesearchaeota archaeon]